MRPTPDSLREKQLPSSAEVVRSPTVIDRLRRSFAFPVFVSLSMLAASAGADEKKAQKQDPYERIELLKKEYEAHPVSELVRLLDSTQFPVRAASFSILQKRVHHELRQKKPFPWKTELSTEGKSSEQKRSLGTLLEQVEMHERSLWWEPTVLTFDEKEREKMSTVRGAMEVLQKKMDCKLVFHATQSTKVMDHKVTNIPASGDCWQVLRSLRVGDKQIVPFGSDGALYLMLEDADVPTTSDGALYGKLTSLDAKQMELHVYAEPKLFAYSRQLVSVKDARKRDMEVHEAQERFGTYKIEKPTGLGSHSIVTVSVLVTGVRMKKFPVEGGHGKTLRFDGNEFYWDGLQEVPNQEGSRYSRISAPDFTEALNGVHCEMFDDAGSKIETQMQASWRFFPKVRTWKVMENRKPSSAFLYVPGSTPGSSLRTLQFRNAPHAPALPES